MNPLLRIVIIVLIVLGVIVLSLFSFVKLRHGIFVISRIEVIGCETIEAPHVVSLAGIRAGHSLLFLSSGAVKRAVETGDPLITVAAIHKKFPDTVIIRIRERTAVAIVRTERMLAEASADGHAIRDSMHVFDLPVISRFPSELSNGMFIDATLLTTLTLFGELRSTDRALYDIISEISYSGDEARVYPRHFKLTALVKNPADRETLKKLQAILVMLREKRQRAEVIDLRFKDAVIRQVSTHY
ncbi:MAG: FtsQ-type POTRA domain-containing protein [Spirochaetota bacterium]